MKTRWFTFIALSFWLGMWGAVLFNADVRLVVALGITAVVLLVVEVLRD